MVLIYIKVYLDQKKFIYILIIFIIRIIILLNRGKSFVLILFGWDLLGLTRLLLVLYYKSLHVNISAFYITLVNSLSDSIIIILIILYTLLREAQYINFVIYLVSITSIRKSAIWPIHYWLPIAIDAPTPVRCLLHSRTLVVAGYYVYTSINISSNNHLLLFFRFISYLISLNYIWCCEDIKKFVAYSTMINISIIMIYASSMYREISYIHVVSHRLYKSRLFLIVGYMLMLNSGNQDMRCISIPFMSLSLIIILMLNNLGIFFIFTISTEHLFKLLTIPTHLFVLPILTLSIFFLMKITIKLLEVIATNKSLVLSTKLNKYFYTLVIPMVICLLGDIYFNKLMPIVYYESWFNNLVFILLIFVVPISTIHKTEIDSIAPIRLDQQLSREIFFNIMKKLGYVRYNAIIL